MSKVKIPVRQQEAEIRVTNFEEVCLGYNKEEAMKEASKIGRESCRERV